MLENSNLAVFSPLLHSQFSVRPTPDLVVALELVQAADRGSNPRQEQFALLFRGPLDPFLPQHLYAVEHDELGQFALFLVPVARDEQGYSYEAVFNRLRQ